MSSKKGKHKTFLPKTTKEPSINKEKSPTKLKTKHHTEE